MKHYQLVVFDLDGTLLNTLDDLAGSVNYALHTHGFPQHTLEEVRSYIGHGISSLIRNALPAGTDDASHARVLETFKPHYNAHQNDLTAPYPGVCELLESLQQAGIATAVLSNKSHRNVQELCGAHFGKWISLAAGEQEGIPRKPAPDGLLRVMKEMNVSAENTLYVGDGDSDVVTAANAGVDCAAVTWGFRSEEQLRAAGAKNLFDSTEKLGDFISRG